LAADIVSSDQRALRAILATYEEASGVPGREARDVETRAAAAFQRGGVDPAEIERRRRGVVERGRSQV
jgi:enoyl-CoA hydratase